MASTTFSARRPTINRRSLSVVAVSGDLLRSTLIDGLLADENDYGPIFIEPFADAYSRIMQVTPDVVIVYCEVGDTAACQLLTMLKMDAGLAGVLVVTCACATADFEVGDLVPQVPDYSPRVIYPVHMN
jgi:hypothetical protein